MRRRMPQHLNRFRIFRSEDREPYVLVDGRAQRLGSKIGGGIDQDDAFAEIRIVETDQNGGPQTRVTRVGRKTNRAVATDCRYPGTRAGTEHSNVNVRNY